jgi:hypothetical protein
MRWNNSAGLLACLLVASCAAVSPLAPPPELLADCPIPSSPVRTNGELAEGYSARGFALRACNDDKAALRAWADQIKKD